MSHNITTYGATASGTVEKVIRINKFLLGTMAGGAGLSIPWSKTGT